MPIKIPDHLPATEVLNNENIFVMTEVRATQQDIRPLRIAVLNLMPTKIVTETQLLRLLGNTPLQVEALLLHPKSYTSKNTPQEHLTTFYKTFDDIREEKFDGLVITGAPVEHMSFEEVEYWDELSSIMEWSKTHVYSTLYICWAAQAGLYYHYGIPKYSLKEKMFGIYPHKICKPNTMLLRGFDDEFYIPHSRHTEVRKEDILKVKELDILAESVDAGVSLLKTSGGRQVFVTGHSEYDPDTLKLEYERDIGRGLSISVPQNYFVEDIPQNPIRVTWRSHAHLLFANWLNYYVYQETPYDLSQL